MLKIQHVTLSFGQKKIFNDLSLNFEEGTIPDWLHQMVQESLL